MDLKNFDKHFKSALDKIEEPFDSSSWLALEQRMNAGFSEEQPAAVEPVDLVVKKSLDRLEAPYRAADWAMLNARLNTNALVRRLRMSKLAELAIFLLLLLNIEGFLGGFKEVLKPKAPQPVKSTIPMAGNIRKKNAKHDNAGTGISTAESLASRVVAIIATPFRSSVTSESDIITASTPVTVGTNKSLLDGALFYNTSGLVPFHKLAPVPQSKNWDFAWQNFFDVIPGVSVPVTHKSNGLYAASFATVDNNYIKSTDFSSRESGYGGGIAVGYRKGRWGVESGVSYAHKNFSPHRDVEIYAGNSMDGFLGTYIKTVDADVFSVPLKVSRRLAHFGRTTAHAVVGVTANVATEKRYGYKQVSFPPTSPDPTPGINPNNYELPERNGNGYFEGGSLKTNAYATADIGLRVEQPLGKRYVAFVEPSYRHALNGGFGPKREKISTFTFQAGVMATL